VTWLSATQDLLNEIGRPAQIRPLADFLVRNERVESRAQDVGATLRASIRRDIRERAAEDVKQRFYTTAGIVGLTSYDRDQFSIDLRESYVSFEREWEPALAAPDSGSWEFEVGLPDWAPRELSRKAYSAAARSGRKNYMEVPVWFATDRNRTKSPSVDRWYGSGRGQLEYGRIKVSIPDRHRIGRVERPRWWHLKEHDPDKFITLLSGERWSYGEFRSRVRQRLAQGALDVLVFVHGYNVTFADAVYRTAQVSYDLKYNGIPLCFSWPSQGTASGYIKDETNNGWSEPHLDEVLSTLADLDVSRIHLLSHSMGGRSTCQVVEKAVAASKDWPNRLAQLMFAAPDIDADVFRRIVASFHPAERATMYASANDKAITASRGIHGYRRAGDVIGDPLVVAGLDTIDASDRDTSLMGHSYFSQRYEVLNDLYVLVGVGHEPNRRFGLQERLLGSLPYWAFLP
jgi:esterase/lipase superfamily enzyme